MFLLGQDKLQAEKKNPYHIIIHLYTYYWLFLSAFAFHVSILHFICKIVNL